MKIGIIYSLVDENAKDAESFNEIKDTVKVVSDILKKNKHKVVECILRDPNLSVVEKQLKQLKKETEIVFNFAESIGEDTSVEWKIAKMMSDVGIKYTGADWNCLKTTTNKILMKDEMIRAKIPTPHYQIFNSLDEKFKLTYPVIIKPSREGGSIGIFKDSVAENEKQLKKCVKRILDDYKQPALVEEFINGLEFQVGIIAGKPQIVLPIAELIYTLPKGRNNILTYDGKWSEDSVDYKETNTGAPVNLTPILEKKLILNAKKTHKLFGSPDYCRVDFRTKGDDVFVLELNANPCANPIDSGFAKQLKRANISYEEFIQKLIELTIEK